MRSVFSGGFDPSRVNAWGVALMLLSVLLTLFAEKLTRLTEGHKHPLSANHIKLAALLLCAGGALLAILA